MKVFLTTKFISITIVFLLENLNNILLSLVVFLFWPIKIKEKKVKNILIYRIGNIGDIFCSIPAIYSIKIYYPNSNIILLTSPGRKGDLGAKSFLYNQGWISEIYEYYLDNENKLNNFYLLSKKLKSKNIDLWIDLPSQFDQFNNQFIRILFAKICRAKDAFGWQVSCIKIFKQIQSEYRNFPTELERLCQILSAKNIQSSKYTNILNISQEDEYYVKKLINKGKIEKIPLVALAPCAKRSTNLWTEENFVSIIETLIKKGFGVIIIGGNNDEIYCNSIKKNIQKNIISIAGKCSILQSCAILKLCEFVICVDSGVQHMASAFGVPTISLFSARDFRGKWNPYGEKNIVIRKKTSCEICLLEECPKNNYCMTQITAVEVESAINKINLKVV